MSQKVTILLVKKQGGHLRPSEHLDQQSLPDSNQCLANTGTALKMSKVNKRCKQKAKIALSEDRLLTDKLYLNNLAKGITKAPEITLEKVN